MFITIEGADGVGKTTQARLLARRLAEDAKFKVLLTQEPWRQGIGGAIMPHLLRARPAEAFHLIAAAREQHLEKCILPHLAGDPSLAEIFSRLSQESASAPGPKRTPIVVCDRYVDSTWAYQVTADHSLDTIFVACLQRWLIPQLTIILDIDEETLEARERARQAAEAGSHHTGVLPERSLDREYFEQRARILEAFRAPICLPGRRIRTIDVSRRDAASTHEEIWKAVGLH